MKKVVAYGAYNYESEVEEFKQRVNSEIAKNKEWELKKVYIDYGANKRYEALTTLLNEIFDEKKDIILIKNVKQFIKVIQGMEFIIKYLEKEKVEIRFLDENLSTSDIVGKMQVTIMLSMDKYERERKAENVKHCKILKKEELKENANKSRSEKMKEWWKDEADREMMSAKMKIGKEFKKRER